MFHTRIVSLYRGRLKRGTVATRGKSSRLVAVLGCARVKVEPLQQSTLPTWRRTILRRLSPAHNGRVVLVVLRSSRPVGTALSQATGPFRKGRSPISRRLSHDPNCVSTNVGSCCLALTPAWHAGFLAMMPTIEQYACIAFRHLKGDSRDDAVEEAIANALVAYVRLVELKKTKVAHPTVLAKYAVAQVRDGRRVGNHLNVREVLSQYAQRKGFCCRAAGPLRQGGKRMDGGHGRGPPNACGRSGRVQN